jgi:hypothetical protein
MPEVPDVAILHCGELPHHKMGIRVRMKITDAPDSVALYCILVYSYIVFDDKNQR